VTSYPANKPIEDRFTLEEQPDFKLAGVFDGHGGWQIADFVQKNVVSTYQTHYTQARGGVKDRVKAALIGTFNSLEDKIVDSAKLPYQMGFGNVSTVGACGLVAVVFSDFYALANAGDCQAVLVTSENGVAVGTNLCAVHSSNSPEEQARLMREHPKDKDIVKCKHAKACYVKGRLMPTRSFGDLHLKHAEFNNPCNYSPLQGFRKSHIQDFAGPYITHQPDVYINDITAQDRYLILATDGLWDDVTVAEAAQITAEVGESQAAAEALLERALANAAANAQTSVDSLKQMELGRRRSYHDDITIIVIPLNAQR
jgi:pyruvate dehydrogenase phosphatase